MDRIRKNLYIGNASDPKNTERLNKEGITAILNVAYELNDPIYFTHQFRCVKVGLEDSEKNSVEMRQLAIDTLATLLEHGENVLVHCAAGQSRSVFVAAHGFAKYSGEHPEAILDEILKSRAFSHKGPLWKSFGYKPIGAE